MKKGGGLVILSVGGSLIVPDDIDTAFISRLRALVLSYAEKGYTFAIVPGGGKTARRYQAAGRELGVTSQEETDWLGIFVNNMHADFFRILFGKRAAPLVVKDFSQPFPAGYPVVIVGPGVPGHSSDVDAVQIAKLAEAKHVVNLSNIDYVYTADPKEDPSAVPIKEISWSDFRAMFGDEWTPGKNTPFDPVAAKKADELGLEVVIMNGKKLEELENYLAGKEFVGTVIR